MPASFVDRTGRTWHLESTTAAVKRVRLATGLRISQVAADGTMPDYVKAQSDQEVLAAVLFAWCGQQHPGMTLDKFEAEVMAGETVGDARAAMDEAFLLFFPSRHQQTIRTVAADMERRAMASLTGATSSTPATDSPGSSGSTPPHSASAN